MHRDHDALVAFIEGHARTPFAYDPSGLDCVRFAAGAVEAQTGENPLRRTSHAWTTEREARLALAALGGLEEAVNSVLPRIGIGQARGGDIAGVPGEDGLLLAVIEGSTLVGLGPDGLRRLPRSAMTCAWSAG